MRKYLLILLFAFCFLPLAVAADDSQIVISPSIIDEKAKAGDILKYEVSISNNSDGKVDIYAIVNDILKDEGDVGYADPRDLDRSTSIVRWLSFKRGAIELMPGATTTVPLEININSAATPGKRFARIALPTGTNRDIAENSMSTRAYTQLPISIEIMENAIEKMKIAGFASGKTLAVRGPIDFNIKLENGGNKTETPIGNLFIFNRRGEEVSSIDINHENKALPAGETWSKALAWEDLRGLGKFKAKLEIEYGEKGKRDLQDTLYFWYFPWKFLLAIFMLTFLFLALMVTLIFRKTFVHHDLEERSKLPVRRSKAVSRKVVNLKK